MCACVRACMLRVARVDSVACWAGCHFVDVRIGCSDWLQARPWTKLTGLQRAGSGALSESGLHVEGVRQCALHQSSQHLPHRLHIWTSTPPPHKPSHCRCIARPWPLFQTQFVAASPSRRNLLVVLVGEVSLACCARVQLVLERVNVTTKLLICMPQRHKPMDTPGPHRLGP